jgi:hypothetical protein
MKPLARLQLERPSLYDGPANNIVLNRIVNVASCALLFAAHGG